MQSHIDFALNASTNSDLRREFEDEIAKYTGDDPLDPWYRYIEWISNLKEYGHFFQLVIKCIDWFWQEKKYHNDCRFTRICLLHVRMSEDKIEKCSRLFRHGICDQEGLFYIMWANSYETNNQKEEAEMIYKKGLKMSTSHVSELRNNYEKFLKRHKKESPLIGSHQETRKSIQTDEKALIEKFMIPIGEIYKDSKEYCIEELMALGCLPGKHQHRKTTPPGTEVESVSKSLNHSQILQPSKRKSVFGLVPPLENITEESESYQTFNSTFSPMKQHARLPHLFTEAHSSTLMLPSVSLKPTIGNSESNTSIDINASCGPSHHGIVNPTIKDVEESDDEEEEEETQHSKFAKGFLEKLFFGSSRPRKSLVGVVPVPVPDVADKEMKESFVIYEDPVNYQPFTIFEDPSVVSTVERQKSTPELEMRNCLEMSIMNRENIDPVNVSASKEASIPSKKFESQISEETSFFNTTLVKMPLLQMERSLASIHDFFNGLEPSKTSTQNVTDAFKCFLKSKKGVEFMDCSTIHPELEVARCPDVDINVSSETLKMTSGNDSFIKDHHEDVDVKKSILADSRESNLDRYQSDRSIDESVSRNKRNRYDLFKGNESICHHSVFGIASNKQNFSFDLPSNGTSLISIKSNDGCDFVTTYEEPLNDLRESNTKGQRSSSNWRRCSIARRLEIIDEDDLNISYETENRILESRKPSVALLSTSFLNNSILIDAENPYNEEVIRAFICRLVPPLSEYPGFHEVKDCKMPEFKKDSSIHLGTRKFIVKKKLGEGAYAKAYQLSLANCQGTQRKDCVAKIQRPPCPWEFYITRELHKRLKELTEDENFVDVTPSLMKITEAYFFEDGSLFLNDMHNYGTLLDLINLQKSKLIEIPQWFVIMLSFELVCIVDAMHKCSMLHGDLKADNVLIRQLPLLKQGDYVRDLLKKKTTFLKLIDFGQSIDMAMYPPGTEFTAKSTKKDFHCTEMKTGKPWSYQIDLYFLAGLMYVLMMGNYMNPTLKQNRWSANVKLKRSWKHEETIRKFFDMLINVESAEKMPDLSIISAWLYSSVDVDVNTYNMFIRQLTSIYDKK